MKFTIEIGEAEKHRVEYYCNQLTGTLVITINCQPVARRRWLLNEPVVEVHSFDLGEREQHNIRIEKQRNPLFGQRNRVFVDNRLVRVFDGN